MENDFAPSPTPDVEPAPFDPVAPTALEPELTPEPATPDLTLEADAAPLTVAPVQHTIEHRSFGRASAEHPMRVTSITGGL